MDKNEFFMKKAIEKAKQAMRSGQTPFGACITSKEGKIISCEHNVVWKTTDITAHGEIHAIRVACKKIKNIKLTGCTIYSTTEPCPMCFSAIHWAGIKKIVYGASITDAQKAGFSELTISNKEMKRIGKSPVGIQSGFMRTENVELFEEFRRKKGKTY
ncbi:MAG: nucleoside deaminase [Candidatus Micrarchaeota archaeon]